MTVERKAVERERTKLANLVDARCAHEACDERLARIVETAAAGWDPRTWRLHESAPASPSPPA